MPFIEAFDFGAAGKNREKATEGITDALCEAYGIQAEIITIYFLDASGGNYGHAGKFGANAEKKRIFVKVHAMPRSDSLRSKAAALMTSALTDAYAVPGDEVSIYFCDRSPEHAAHGGLLGP